MNNFDDIRNIWQNQDAAKVPDMSEVIKAAGKNRRSIIIKNLLGLITLGGTVIFISWIGFAADFKYLTTKLGIVLIVISIIAAMVLNSQMLMLILERSDDTLTNADYLKQLISYRNKQRFFQTKGIALYYLMLTLGFILYLYEFYARNASFGLKAYGLTLLWIAFAWFYIRPRAIKKQEQKINELIEQIESISGQLDDNA